MGFNVNSGGVSISVNTYNKVSGAKNAFKNTSYDDIDAIDFSKYTPVIQRVGFTISDEMPDLPYTLKDFFIDAATVLGRTCATVANVGIAFVSGIVSFAEAIVDCAAVIAGGVGTIFTGIYDIGRGLFTGNWDFKATQAMWKKGIMPFVGTDWTSEGVDFLYEETPLKYVDDAAWSWGKRDGTVCAVSKGVGYYTGMIIATTATCGVGGAITGATSVSSAASTQVIGSITMKTVAQAGMGFAGSLGKNTQSNYNVAVAKAQAEGREVTMENIGGSIGKAFGSAVIDGGIYFAAGAAGDSLKAMEMNKTLTNTVVIGTKASKAYISEGYNCLLTGEQYDFAGATIDAGSTVIAEVAALKMQNVLYKAPKDSSLQSAASNVAKTDAVDVMDEFGEGFSSANGDAVSEAAKISAKEIAIYSVKTGIAKGEEKAVKEVASVAYDAAGGVLGGLISE